MQPFAGASGPTAVSSGCRDPQQWSSCAGVLAPSRQPRGRGGRPPRPSRTVLVSAGRAGV